MRNKRVWACTQSRVGAGGAAAGQGAEGQSGDWPVAEGVIQVCNWSCHVIRAAGVLGLLLGNQNPWAERGFSFLKLGWFKKTPAGFTACMLGAECSCGRGQKSEVILGCAQGDPVTTLWLETPDTNISMLSPPKEGDGKFFWLLSHPIVTMEINAHWSALIPQAGQQQLAGWSAVSPPGSAQILQEGCVCRLGGRRPNSFSCRITTASRQEPGVKSSAKR